MTLKTFLNAAWPHPKASLDQLVKEAQRDFARLPHGLAWRHPLYGYVARSDSMKTYWAFTSVDPSHANVLRSPNGRQRQFRSADAAMGALVARVYRAVRLDDAKLARANAKLPSFYGGDNGRDPDADRDARLDDAKHFGD